MSIFLVLVMVMALCTVTAFAQKPAAIKTIEKPEASIALADSAVMEMAKAVFAAHGGDKLRAAKTLVVRGSVDITSTAFNQAIPSGFSMVISGEKYRVELANQIQSFKQVFDGEQTFTSVQTGFTLPPINRLGLPLLARLGDKGFMVSRLPESAKKRQGFRLTAPDGFYTDFYIDEKTKMVKGYESLYEFSGRTATTSVEIDKYRTVDGVVVPERYAQRFDLGQLTIYGDFKSKEILVNSEVADDVFSMGK